MTRELSGPDLARRLGERYPGAVVGRPVGPTAVEITPVSLAEVAAYLKREPDLAFDYLASITAVDYLDYFEVTYHFTSLAHNHSLVLKVRCRGREDPSLPSLTPLWQGADLQEREVYDLMGIAFRGHPNMKRVLLWEGFKGHPLRKDFIYDTA